MIQIFFHLKSTKDAIIGWQNLVLSLQEVTGAVSVFQQEPEEDFMFLLSSSFPEPGESCVNLPMSNEMFRCRHLCGYHRRSRGGPKEGTRFLIFSYTVQVLTISALGKFNFMPLLA
jgi:hypothetical protein